MGCLYNSWDGKCSVHDPGFEMGGCGDDGICVVDDDPFPGDNCESFQDISRICDRCGGNAVGECNTCSPEDWE